MLDFLPVTARPYERSILIIYYVLGIKNIHDIQKVLGQKSSTRIYQTLAKYRGKIDVPAITHHREPYPLVTLFQ